MFCSSSQAQAIALRIAASLQSGWINHFRRRCHTTHSGTCLYFSAGESRFEPQQCAWRCNVFACNKHGQPISMCVWPHWSISSIEFDVGERRWRNKEEKGERDRAEEKECERRITATSIKWMNFALGMEWKPCNLWKSTLYERLALQSAVSKSFSRWKCLDAILNTRII